MINPGLRIYYSRLSISRTRISRILRNSQCLFESQIHFDCFIRTLFGVGYFFTSPNYPKCKLICTSGNLNLKKQSPQLRDIESWLYSDHVHLKGSDELFTYYQIQTLHEWLISYCLDYFQYQLRKYCWFSFKHQTCL